MPTNENKEKDEVNIIIDRKHKRSPNPTTGNALYVLGELPSGYTLFRETPGPKDDEPIPNDATIVHLKDGDHFYSSQETINPGAY